MGSGPSSDRSRTRLEQGSGGAVGDSSAKLHHACCPHRSPTMLRSHSTRLQVPANPASDFLFWNETYQVTEKSFLGVRCFLKEHPLLGCGFTHKKPEPRQCCSHHHKVMLSHEGVRILLSLIRGAWLTGPVIRQ